MFLDDIRVNGKPVIVLKYEILIYDDNSNLLEAWSDGNPVMIRDKITVNGVFYTAERLCSYIIENQSKISNLLKYRFKNYTGSEKFIFVLYRPRSLDKAFRKAIRIECVSGKKSDLVVTDMCDVAVLSQQMSVITLVDFLSIRIGDQKDFLIVTLLSNYQQYVISIYDRRRFDMLIAKNKFIDRRKLI